MATGSERVEPSLLSPSPWASSSAVEVGRDGRVHADAVSAQDVGDVLRSARVSHARSPPPPRSIACPSRGCQSPGRTLGGVVYSVARAWEGAMSDRNAAFVGSIPENYDRYLGPMFFHPYADDLAGRLVVTPGMRVLEVACGTGLLTRRVLERLRGRGSILATDLNEAMLAYRSEERRVGKEGRTRWEPVNDKKKNNR